MSIKEMTRLTVLGCTILLALTGCSGLTQQEKAQLRPQKASNDIPEPIKQCKPQCVTSLGMSIYKLGNQVKLVLPTHLLFFENSSHFKPYGYLLMEQAVDYINYYDKAKIRVAAYTDDQFGTDATKALTRQQAQDVVRYMRQQDLIANFIYSDGQGGNNPVALHDKQFDRQENQRIELTFDYYGYIYQENN
jgi:outer membrane protein OmpA-like peptidoglycan-associated protein